jgi:PAP2 superfamily
MTPGALNLWLLVSRLGEAEILLPAALLAVGLLLYEPAGRVLGGRWLWLLGVAAAVTTVTKLAFLGWGVGWAAADFTGVSGHAMFATAIYPVLLGAMSPPMPRAGRWLAVAAGAMLALLVGVSRVVVHAHSISEVVAGMGLGAVVSGAVLMRGQLSGACLRPWVPALLALWLAAMPAYAPPSQTHAIVVRLALALSGREVPYTRAELRDFAPVGSPLRKTQ